MTEPFKLISSVYLLLRRDDELLLLRRANTGYHDGRYSLVAGHLNGDERATDAIAREAREEAGIEVQASSLRFVHTCHRLTRGTPGQERLDPGDGRRRGRGDRGGRGGDREGQRQHGQRPVRPIHEVLLCEFVHKLL